MPKNIPKELEKEILGLPQKDKDRHLLRLISRNKLLLEQMKYDLMEDEADLYLRKEALREHILGVMAKPFPGTAFFLKAFRKLSTEITWHRRVAKDKYGEVDMQILCLEQAFEKQIRHVGVMSRKGDVLRTYMVKKALSVLKMINALHEDYRIDFAGRMNQILKLLHTFETKYDAQKLSLPESL
ncbi:hypothetical protein [Jiulongibacter sediminis]|uniref:Uncharacterized protein n=1 Tax=Jiulongibacter sediminis TaxID=1605367 RepID=A0A0N8HAF8_9BACT|nr:hypothetical protein [Jiulongibacter sediminis]KPM50052.1 hypothetical protein AFM12_05775 [Jiulongibacter sediminis]TBX27078.1 hypothetical protein TK44_05780 [Jiulongibacter sediminis]